jgi:hypothetical protein
VPHVDDNVQAVWSMLSEPRMAPYLRITGNDQLEALGLYEWSTRTSAAAFEDIGHLEVLFRNALDRQLREYFREEKCGIPWFLLPTPGGEHVAEAVATVRERLRPLGKESRHQIVAGLSFGFWSGLLGSRYEELWRDCIHRAFPHSSGRRKQVSAAMERARKFRNRLAHHDSMINVDVPFEIRHIIELASFIDKDAANWLERRSTTMTVYGERPTAIEDTVVVAARNAWALYENVYAYVWQPARAFRTVERIAFYADREIKRDVPKGAASPGQRGVDERRGRPTQRVRRSVRPEDCPSDRRRPKYELDRWSLSGVSADEARRSNPSAAQRLPSARWQWTRFRLHPATALCLTAFA